MVSEVLQMLYFKSYYSHITGLRKWTSAHKIIYLYCYFHPYDSHLGSEVTRNVDLQVRKMEAEAEVKSMGLAVAHMEEEIARLRKNITAVGEDMTVPDWVGGVCVVYDQGFHPLSNSSLMGLNNLL